MSVDRRNWLRKEKIFQVLVQTPAGRFGSFVARNICGGGLFLEAEDPFPEGCPVQLFFALPQADCGIAARGKVNHRDRHHQPDTGEPITGMGIRFLGFADSGEDQLGECLARELD